MPVSEEEPELIIAHPALGEPPSLVDFLKSIGVIPANDWLQRKLLRLLEDHHVGFRGRPIRAVGFDY